MNKKTVFQHVGRGLAFSVYLQVLELGETSTEEIIEIMWKLEAALPRWVKESMKELVVIGALRISEGDADYFYVNEEEGEEVE